MDEWLKIVIEQYKSVRTEALASINSQTTVASIGLTFVGALIGAGINFLDKPMVSETIFLFLIPVFCEFILVSWFGEVYRMVRAGVFLAEVESKVNRYFASKEKPHSEKALCWEEWLVNNKKLTQININYQTYILLFTLCSSISIIIDTIICRSKHNDPPIIYIWGITP